MQEPEAIQALSALAQDTRLSIMRTLIAAGPEGMFVGDIKEAVGAGRTALSFHLKELQNAELVDARRSGRHIYYSAKFERVRGLLDFLMSDCCHGRPEICGFDYANAAEDNPCPPKAKAGA